MQPHRFVILATLAILTIFFLAAAYAVWLNDIPQPLSANPASSQPPVGATVGAEPGNDVRAVDLAVNESGMAGITARELRAHNMPIENLNESPLNLSYRGEQVPFLISGEGEDATLYFYAETITSTLVGPAVYRLELDESGVAMARHSATPTGTADTHGQQTFHWSENLTFAEHAPGTDLWMGPLLFSGGAWSYPFNAIIPDGDAAELTMTLLSNTETAANPDYQLEISINGRVISNHTWDGIRYEQIRIPLEPGVLRADTSNTLTVRLLGDTNGLGNSIYLDNIQLSYSGPLAVGEQQVEFTTTADTVAILSTEPDLMVFDVTNLEQPIHLTDLNIEDNRVSFKGTGSRYVAMQPDQIVRPAVEPVPTWSRSLRDTTRQADYIAVVPDVPGFDSAIEPLLAYRRQQGLSVASISLEQIFDEFSYGQQTPDAIRAFLTYAADNWQGPAPRYVLLVGDATNDIRNLALGKNRNLVPTPLIQTGRSGYTASDTWYTLDDNDEARMMIGRFPAQDAGELSTMVAKTIQYEQQSQADATWPHRALLVADDEPQFDVASTALASDLSDDGYTVYDVHMSQNDNVKFDIMSAINRGVGLINYTGHGSERMWGDEAVLETADAANLKNGSRLPILTTFTCRNGAFADPRIDTLAESLLRVEDGGVVAAIAPSGRGNSSLQVPLATDFYAILLHDENDTLGAALLAMHGRAAEDPSLQSVLPMVNLLGDPALQFATP